MRITGLNRPSLSPVAGAVRRAEGGAVFSPMAAATGGAAATTAAAGTASLAGLDALLALQALPAEKPNRQKTVRRGHDVLNVLDEMKLGLLGGPVGGEALERLATLVREGRSEELDDPVLAGLMADIELRAMVELAKHGKFVD
ncbi:flagellar assembly protein FliX [Methylobrevis albus]|uniref:Flagellar assembly protein FliX n=1 Tax=Methylobrevis albus TaxID=2793297 RepID=A0A931HYT9_9HYPH|nr:flagellar assembly protein FliX [Methylobrevis albus]MBH0236865.1 flagellar assembly protein FliX [Methylobrevis albus]